MRWSRRSRAKSGMTFLWAGATKEEPFESAAIVPWTTVEAGEATAATQGGAAGALGPATGELAAVALGPAAMAAPRVEVPVGRVGPWRTRSRKE